MLLQCNASQEKNSQRHNNPKSFAAKSTARLYKHLYYHYHCHHHHQHHDGHCPGQGSWLLDLALIFCRLPTFPPPKQSHDFANDQTARLRPNIFQIDPKSYQSSSSLGSACLTLFSSLSWAHDSDSEDILLILMIIWSRFRFCYMTPLRLSKIHILIERRSDYCLAL